MKFEVLSLSGQRSFKEVYEIQLDLLAKRIADQIPDTYIFCEHTPTITRGRGLQHKPGSPEDAVKQKPLLFVPEGTEYLEIERGGDLTWHGPGQLVIYPIVKLSEHDIEKWIRFLENQWIAVLKNYGIAATTQIGGSGVWLADESGQQKKLASIGIALRRWVNFHGMAINVVNDLDGFMNFDPCGFSSEVMISAKELKELPPHFFDADWRSKWEALFIKQLRSS